VCSGFFTAFFFSTNSQQIELQRRKGEPIPEGWAIDSQGKMTRDADVAMKGCLMPLGGPEYTSGYKGYGLAFLVEIFCGISAGIILNQGRFLSNMLISHHNNQAPLTGPISEDGWTLNDRPI